MNVKNIAPSRCLAILIFIIIGAKSFASTDPVAIQSLAGQQITAGATIQVLDRMYDGTPSGKLNTIFPVKNVVTLRINEDGMYLLPKKFMATVTVRAYLTKAGGAVDSLDKQLTIRYNIDSVYNNRAYFTDTGAHKVQVKVLSVAVDSSSALFWLFLDNELYSSPDYIFNCTGSDQAVTKVTLAANTGLDSADEVHAAWSLAKYGADEYDLEWAYVDSTALGRFKVGGNFVAAKIFDNNATRVSTTDNLYDIPAMFGNGGVLFARARAVKILADGTRLAAAWSSDYSLGLGIFAFVGHQRQLNWQSSISYAEGGKRKVVVQYFDGSLRSRQTVTQNNTDNLTVVAETLYDFQGRPTIQVMPAPTLNSLIKYARNFNQYNGNADGTAEYEKQLYDTLASPASYGTTAAPAMDSANSGAAFYYSSLNYNANTTKFTAKFVPLAYGYAFTETEYTQDNTGRISRQGGVGANFALNSGHEARYYYGSPDQTELDALFGTEAGDKNHYFKNMVQDANGQLSVSYVDMHGRTIATALAGQLPDSAKLDTLGSRRTIPVTENLASPLDNVVKGLAIQSQKSLLVSTPGTYTFRYDLGPQSFKAKACAGDSVCYSCLYNLQITITDDRNNQNLRGDKAYDTTISNFSLLNINANGCATDTGFHFKDTLNLPVGNYEITKTLTVSSTGRQQYRDSIFMARNTCKTPLQFLQVQQSLQAVSNCAPVCKVCLDSLGDWPSFRVRYMTQTGILPADSAGYRPQALLAYQSAQDACTVLCNTANTVANDARQAMLNDMAAPAGQYAKTSGSADIYSIFYYPGPDQPMPYQDPLINYTNVYGNPSLVYDDSTGTKVPPQKLDSAQFARKFQQSWATALLPKHPEYCKLLAYESYKSSQRWDKPFEKVETFDTALAKGYLNPTANTTVSPFASYTAVAANKDSLAMMPLRTGLKDSLENRLKSYRSIQTSLGTYTVSLWTFAAMTAKCNGNNACNETFIKNNNNNSNKVFDSLACTADKNFAWRIFRTLYLQLKTGMTDSLVKNANCGGTYQAVASSVLNQAGHYPNFNTAIDAMSQAGLSPYTSSADTNVLKAKVKVDMYNYYLANANAYVPLWVQQLAPCTYYDSATLYGVIIPQLKAVCLKGSDAQHPYGAREISDDSTNIYKSFTDVINAYNLAHGITDKLNCNADKITAPAPYHAQPVYTVKPVLGKPSDCECSTLGNLYSEYQQNKIAADANFSGYLARRYHTNMAQADLDKLRSLCADTAQCKYVTTPISLPPILQCNSGEVCTTCNTVKNLYNSFVETYDTVPPPYNNVDTVSYAGINQLFADFMNNRLGYNLQASQYLNFLGKCNNAGTTVCVGCDSLQSLIKGYFDTLHAIGAGSEADMLLAIQRKLSAGGLVTTTAEVKSALDKCHNGWQANVAYNNDKGRSWVFSPVKNINVGLNNASFTIEQWANFKTGPMLNAGSGMGLQGLESYAGYNFYEDTLASLYNIKDAAGNHIGLTPADSAWIIAHPEWVATPHYVESGFRVYWRYGQVYFEMVDTAMVPAAGGAVGISNGGAIWMRTRQRIEGGQWHHIVITRNGRFASGVKFFIDGQPVQTDVIAGCDTLLSGNVDAQKQYQASSACGMLITNSTCGGGYAGSSPYIKGLRMYGRVLDSTEIHANYVNCNSNPADTSGMRLWAKMNDANGPVNDYSSYNTTGGWQYSGTLISWWGGRGPAVCPACLVHTTGVLCQYPIADSLLLCGNSSPVLPPVTETPASCCTDTAWFAASIAAELNRVYLDSLRGSFDSSYNTKCLRAANYESFTVSHNVSEYHYTLYYYDQAGNLLKTVPPAGVKGAWRQSWYDSVKAARAAGALLVPAHTLVTQYRYNTLNQVVAQQTPDAGKSLFWYDRLGRLAVSQNARQNPQNKYSYTEYDYLGRIKQVGELTSSNAITNAISRVDGTLQAWLTAAANTKTQITATVYDAPYTPLNTYMAAANLRNRVAYVALYNTYADIGTLNHATATFYSYDVHGNVDTLVQDYKGGIMATYNNRFKRIVYQYDLISGKVNWVGYQSPVKVNGAMQLQPDAFYHRYTYDAENRLTNVETSADSVVWENDAAYTYYRHGPLAQTILGAQQVQGIDYAYTLQGWLKVINSSLTAVSRDMGHDGMAQDAVGRYIAKDAYNLTLYYYPGDYTSAASGSYIPVADISGLGSNGFKKLYNGNIAAMAVNMPVLGSSAMVYSYGYDQLNRLTKMDAYGGTPALSWMPTLYKGYNERISYDANGNILTYNRYGPGTTSASIMDSLKYAYYPNTNRLDSISDIAADNAFADDIDNQAAHNYVYDAIGNLTKDKKNGVDSIYWNVYGKITQVVKKDTTSITYTYDAAGNRISKAVAKPGASTQTTWYVRDASGNVMSIYSQGDNTLNAGQLTQAEVHLYGSSRLGILRPNVNVYTVTAPDATGLHNLGYNYVNLRGRKFFELSNHLGNVLVTISDKKTGVDNVNADGIADYFTPDVVSAQDYYPFGMLEPGRQYNAAGSSAYRYGFNGKEKSDEIEGSGVDYDYGFRIYDARVGKFLSVDPLIPKYPELTPYQFASNTPIQAIDIEGLEKYIVNQELYSNGATKSITIQYTVNKDKVRSLVDMKFKMILGKNQDGTDKFGKTYLTSGQNVLRIVTDANGHQTGSSGDELTKQERAIVKDKSKNDLPEDHDKNEWTVQIGKRTYGSETERNSDVMTDRVAYQIFSPPIVKNPEADQIFTQYNVNDNANNSANSIGAVVNSIIAKYMNNNKNVTDVRKEVIITTTPQNSRYAQVTVDKLKSMGVNVTLKTTFFYNRAAAVPSGYYKSPTDFDFNVKITGTLKN